MVDVTVTAVQSALPNAQADPGGRLPAEGAASATGGASQDGSGPKIFQEMTAQQPPHRDAMLDRVGRSLEEMARGLQAEEAQLRPHANDPATASSGRSVNRPDHGQIPFEAFDPVHDPYGRTPRYTPGAGPYGDVTARAGLEPSDGAREVQEQNLAALQENRAANERMGQRIQYQLHAAEVSNSLTNGLNTINKLLQAK